MQLLGEDRAAGNVLVVIPNAILSSLCGLHGSLVELLVFGFVCQLVGADLVFNRSM